MRKNLTEFKNRKAEKTKREEDKKKEVIKIRTPDKSNYNLQRVNNSTKGAFNKKIEFFLKKKL